MHATSTMHTTSNTHDTGVNGCTNLISLTLSGTYDGSKPVFLDASNPSRSISRQKATELVASLAGAFDKDTTVCLHLPNDILYPVLMLSILASGCRWMGTNTAYTHHELEHLFRVSNTKYIITLPENLMTVEAAIRDLPKQDIEIILFCDILSDTVGKSVETRDFAVGNLRTLHDLLTAPNMDKLQQQLQEISIDDVAALQSTSGTTGLPKMAARTHRSLMIESTAIEDNNSEKPYEVRRLFCTPIFHSFSTAEMAINPLRVGYQTWIMKRFDDSFAQKVYDFGITETAAPPPMIMKLLEQSERHHLLQTLRLILSGGAPLAPELRARMLEIFAAPLRIVQVWGMTEGGWFTSFKYPENDTTGSVGRPNANFEVKVGEEGSMQLANGHTAGELLMRSQQLMIGYLGNPKATEETFIDGWMRTGDIGYVEDGKVYIVDRAKDLIKVNGWQVAPAELEAAMLQSTDVLDAAAIGVGHGINEHPMIFVVPRHAHVVVKDVETHLRSRLTRYKVASAEIKLVDSIPKNPSGKILRKVLRAQVAETTCNA